MRILVVDDEQIMLDAICKILKPETGIQLETARTGREAIEKNETFHPQLIMLDIKMPGLNGLEALMEIRRMNPSVVAVIISAYDHFNYAQEAIRLNVYDYLLKPVSKTRLLELVAKVQKHLEHLHSLRQNELTLREQYQKLQPFIETEFIQALQTGVNPVALQEYQEMLGLQFDAGFFIALAHPEETAAMATGLEGSYYIRETLSKMADSIRRRFDCLIASMRSNPLIVFFPINRAELDEADITSVTESLIHKLLTHLQNENFPVKRLRMGIGSLVHTPEAYRVSYQEALQALNSATDQPLSYYAKNDAASSLANQLDLVFQKITEAVRFGHVFRVESLCRSLAETYSHLEGAAKEQLLYSLLEVVLASYRVSRETCRTPTPAPPLRTLLAMFDSASALELVFEKLTPVLTGLTQTIKELRETQINAVIVKAKEIVDQSFQNDLSLEELSHSVAVSPFYLSRLFREELGIGFAEYLTRLRMEKSLTLLAQGVSVKECSFAVGYNDPNYFSRLFRKYYQLSPTEYRESSLPKKGGKIHGQPSE